MANVGFGGDARLALLSGVVDGVNKKRATEQENERRAILNRLAQVQVEQMEANMQIRRNQAAADEAQAAADEARAAKEAQAAAEQQAVIAGVLRRRNPNLSEEEAAVLAGQMNPTGINRLAIPDEEREARSFASMTPLQQVQYLERQRELQHAERLSQLENSEVGVRLRRAALNPRYESELTGVTEMARQAGFTEEEINDFLGAVQPKKPTGEPKPTAGQQARIELDAQVHAKALVQELGGPEAALGFLRSEDAAHLVEDPEYPLIIKAIQKMLSEGYVEDEGPDPSQAIRNTKGR